MRIIVTILNFRWLLLFFLFADNGFWLLSYFIRFGFIKGFEFFPLEYEGLES